MPSPIEVTLNVQSNAPVVESATVIEVLIEAQAEKDRDAYRLIADRRAQLEDAETLRRMRAL